jgi:uncharacterized protein (TIGR00369 family)
MSGPKPSDFGIPDFYRHWQGDNAEDHIGPFFFYMDGDQPCTAFRIQPRHCNSHDTVHGGVLMTFADYTLCLGANGGENESVVTVSQNNEFTAPASAGDLVQGRAEVVRRGGSIVFARCRLEVEDTTVLVSSAVIKRLKSKA